MPLRTTFTFATLGLGALSTAIAGPTGGTVVGGQGSISTPSSTTTVIDQSSKALNVNWNTFDVGANESVQFRQPSSSAVAFNRILDQNPSQIFGRIDANGKVVLVNPNGILFGRSAQLNVNSLVASSLDAIDFDAASGRYRFSTNRNDPGAILNDGSITAGPGGSITLLGGRVSNTGSIVADYGTVNLVAGRAATLDLAGDGLLKLEVGADLLSNGSGAVAAVENSGSVQANGGHVLLTASAVQDVFANLINNTGVVRANRIENAGGDITLLGPAGTVVSSGTLDASGHDGSSTGGSVQMLGERVGLGGSAVVDVSGASGGGTVLIGGDYQGHNPDVLNANRTFVGADVTINADAGATGNGGRVIVWADDVTRFDGTISARGGLSSGNGGFAEVSGKQSLAFAGGSNLSAAHGDRGTLLLDPNDLTIDPGSAQPGTPPYAGGIVYDFNDGNSTGSIGVDAIASLLIDNDIILRADNSIVQNAALDIPTLQSTAHKSLTLDSHGTMSLEDIIMNGGSLTLSATNGMTLNGALQTTNSPLSITAGSLTMNGTASIVTGAGGVTIEATGNTPGNRDINIAGDVTTTGAPVSITSDHGAITMGNNSTISSGAGVVTLFGNGDVTVAVIATTGNVSVTSTTGDIVDDTSPSTRRITANNLTLNAHGSVGAAGDLDTQVTSLAGTVGADVNIHETNGLRLNGITAGAQGSGDLNVTSDTGDIVVASASAHDTANLTATAGSITDDHTGFGVHADTVSLTANNGSIGGGALDKVGTQANTLKAAAGNVFIADTNTGIVTLDTITATTGNTIDVSGIAVLKVKSVTATSGTVTLTSGAIVDDGSDATAINAGTLTLKSSSNIGQSTGGGTIDTQVDTLNVQSLGDSFIREADQITINHVTSAGSDFTLTTAGFGDIKLGDIAQSNVVSLTASNGFILDDVSNSAPVSVNTLKLFASRGVGLPGSEINLSGPTALTAHAGGDGIFVKGNAALTLDDLQTTSGPGDIKIDTTSGDLIVNSVNATGKVTLNTPGAITDDGDPAFPTLTRIVANDIDLTGASIGSAGTHGEIDIDAATLRATATNGGIYIGAAHALTLTNVSASGSGNDVSVTTALGDLEVGVVSGAAVTLNATSGSITDDQIDTTRVTATSSLDLEARDSIGVTGASKEIDVDTPTLVAHAGNGGTGGVYIGAAGDVTLENVTAGTTNGAINVAGAGNMTVRTVSAPNAVSLTATGAIGRDTVNPSLVSADGLTLSGTAIGTSANKINTDVTTLTASASNGGVYVSEANGLTLTNIIATSSGTTNDIEISSTTGTIGVVTMSGHDVTLTAAGGSITDDLQDTTRISGASVDLEAHNAIGAANPNGDIDINTPTLVAHAGNGAGGNGGVYVTGTNDLTLADVSAAGSNGAITIGDSGNLTVRTVTAPNAVTLAASGGIARDTVNPSLISAGDLTLSAGLAIGSAGVGNAVNTRASTLTATANNGDVYVAEQDGLTLANVTALGAAHNVSVSSASGDIAAGTVSATNTVSLTATTGAITGNGSTSINGTGGVSLSAGTAIGTVTNFSAGTGAPINVTTSGALTAAVTSNTGQINLNISGSPTLAAGAITLGSGTGRAGTVILQSAGDLDVSGLTPGAINIGAGNTTNVGLVSGGILTLPSGGGFTDAPAGSLLVHGTTDVVDNDGTPREFAITANALSFQSGAAGGAVVLDTSVSRLDATIGNNKDLTVNEADGLTVGTLSAAGANVTLNAGGAVADDGNNVTLIVGNNVKLTGTALGASGNELDLQTTTLDATASAGGIYARQAGALGLTAHATGDAVDVKTTGGALIVSAASGTGISLESGGGDLTALGAIDGGSGTMNLTATGTNGAINLASTVSTTGDVTLTAGPGGAIVTGATSKVTARGLTVTGSAIGNASQRLNTKVDTLTATAQNGGIFINEDDALSLAATATGGPVSASTTNGSLTVSSASGNGITFIAGGDGNALTLNGSVNGGAGDVALLASGAGGQINLNNAVTTTGNVFLEAGAASDRGAITSNGGHVAGNLLVANGSSIGASGSQLNTAVTSLNAIGTNGGIYVQEADGLELLANATGSVQVATLNGALNVSMANGNGVNLAAGGSGSNLTVDGAVIGGAGDVTLMADGAIVAGVGNQIGGAKATLRASAIGADGSALNTAVGTLDAQTSNGGIFVSEADDLVLNAAATNGTGDVSLTAGGAIIAGTNSSVAGNTVDLNAMSIGSSGARVGTTAAVLNATSTNGGIFINETDGLALTGSATGGALDVLAGGALVVASAKGDSVALSTTGAGSSITLNGALNTSGAATLTAGPSSNRGAIIAGAGSQVTAASLTAAGSSIGSTASRLNTTVGSLTSTSTSGGTFVTETDALTLNANAASGVLDVQTGNGALVINGASGAGVTLTAGGARSGIAVNGVVEAGTSSVTLTAGTVASPGAVTAAAGNKVSGSTLTIASTSIGSGSSPLNTNINTLNANASSGDVYVREQDGLTLANVRGGGRVDIATAGGNITVNSVNASGDASLSASGGSILDDGDNSTRLTGKTVTLLARAIGGPALNGATPDNKARLDIDTTRLDATATGGGIYIDSLNGLASTSLKASGGADGDVELLTASGDINLQSVSASGTLLLSAARNIYGLPTLGVITARAAELRAGAVDAGEGQIGTLAQPLSLHLNAGNTLRIFVPQTVDPNDPNRAPSTLPSAGVSTTLSLYGAPNPLALLAGFGQFTGLSDTQFTSPAEALVRSIQNQTATVQTVLGLDWASFDPNISLFGTLDPSVCLPGDQRDEEQGASGC